MCFKGESKGMMTPDFADTRTLLDQLRVAGRTFFDGVMHLEDDSALSVHSTPITIG